MLGNHHGLRAGEVYIPHRYHHMNAPMKAGVEAGA